MARVRFNLDRPPSKAEMERMLRDADAKEQAGLVRTYKETGNDEALVSLLRKYPLALQSPTVFEEIARLRELVDAIDEEQLTVIRQERPSFKPERPVLPTETKRRARMSLERFLKAWVEAMLPGFTVEAMKTPPSRGAPSKRGRWGNEKLYLDFQDLMRSLSVLVRYVGEGEFKLKHKESPPEFVDRAAALVQQLHRIDWRSQTADSASAYPQLFPGWKIPKVLPHDVAWEIANHAVQNKVISIRPLLYALLAYYADGDTHRVEAIRRVIEREVKKERQGPRNSRT